MLGEVVNNTIYLLIIHMDMLVGLYNINLQVTLIMYINLGNWLLNLFTIIGKLKFITILLLTFFNTLHTNKHLTQGFYNHQSWLDFTKNVSFVYQNVNSKKLQ